MLKCKTIKKKKKLDNNSELSKLRTASDITKIDIENLKDASTTEAYYSNRYGWTLRRTI